MKLRIFISSVQKEFAEERRLLAEYIRHDPLLGLFFSVFLFEESPAVDVSAAKLYLPEVESSDIYLGIIGGEYGNVDNEGISPTEREYDAATKFGRPGNVDFRAIIWRSSKRQAQVGHKSRAQVGALSQGTKSRHQVKALSPDGKSVETVFERVVASCIIPRTALELMHTEGRTDRTKFKKSVLDTLLSDGILEYTIPDKPRSRLQKYRLTEKGRTLLSV